jgi:hypothetical protein
MHFIGLLRIISRMRVFDNRVLRKIFEPNRDEVAASMV